MFRLFECCALSFFERFVLSFSLKIERFVSDSAEIWICGLYFPSIVLLDRKEKNVRNRVGVSMVKDGESGDLIVKLVNLLPVAVKADVEIPSLAGHQAVGQKTILSGRPSDTNAVPVESAMEIGEKFPYEMPAYSFTVIRIKRECK